MINAFAVALALAAGSIGQVPHCEHGPYILPPGPGYGHGFPNNNPDGYGWYSTGDRLPLGADRTGEYFFRRYYALPIEQMFMPNYYNPYVTRGQRYVSYVGCGGDHPAGGPPLASASTPEHPYTDTIGTGPRMAIPGFTGRVEAQPVVSGGTGLTP